MIKIAVDARPLSSAVSGISRLISKILENLDKDFEFYLCSHLPIHRDFENLLKKPNLHWKTLRITPFSKKGWTWYLTDLVYYLNYRLKPNIFWGTQQTIPFFLKSSIKTMITICDFVLYFYPDSMRKIALYQQKFFLKSSFKKANLSICISKTTMEDAIRFFPFVKNIRAIPLGFDMPKKIKKIENPLLKSNYILAVSTIEPRKNYSTLLEAYYDYYTKEKEEPYSLFIIGKKGWESKEFYDKLEKIQKQTNKIFVLDNVSDQELYNFYQNCAFFVMPSLYEGFGIPIIEALCFNKNVLISDIPVFREIARDYATYIPPKDIEAWSIAIQNFVNLHRNNKLKLVNFDPLQVSWKNTANLYKEAFNSLISS